MSIGKRLILAITVITLTLSLLGAIVRLNQWKGMIQQAARDEMRVHVYALQAAMDLGAETRNVAFARELVRRLTLDPKIFSITVYDGNGHVLMGANEGGAGLPDAASLARKVIATREIEEREGLIDGTKVFSRVLPLRLSDQTLGAVEVTRATAYLDDAIGTAVRMIAVVSLSMLSVMLLSVWLIMRIGFDRPMRALTAGTDALGRGDLEHRIAVPSGGSEFSRLARAFNEMADRLAAQRRQIKAEAESRVEMEKELRLREGEIRHRDRLASVGRLAAGIAHEIGAPLNVIDARAEQLEEQLPEENPPELFRSNLAIIRSQASRITEIVQQLLNLARPYQLRAEPIDVMNVVEEAVEALETEGDQVGVGIDVVPAPEVRILVDRSFLLHVLVNIGNNGIQAMPNGGLLRIEVISKAATRQGRPFAGIRITDTGIGIPTQDLERIFDPFYTTKEIGAGIGLGLAVAKRIVEEQGGWIDAARNFPQGASFTVFVPQVETSAPNGPQLEGDVPGDREIAIAGRGR